MLYFYKLSADQGNELAQLALASCYRYGTGVATNETEAVRYYRLSAEQADASAQYWLGYWYLSVLCELICFLFCNELCVLIFCIHSYNFGYGVTKDLKEAVKWYRLSANQGNASAQYWVGYSFYYGLGVDEDSAEAGSIICL